MTGGDSFSKSGVFPFDALRRSPDVEAENLLAHDASDRLILDLAAGAILDSLPGQVAVVGDRYGTLTLGAAALGARDIRVHQDSFTGRQALKANSQLLGAAPDVYRDCPLSGDLFSGAAVILMQLPKDLRQLASWAALAARFSDPSVQVFAGGRVKHMSRSMNQVFEGYFAEIRASLGRQKSRVLLVSRPIRAEDEGSFLEEHFDRELGLRVQSFPGAFASGKVDIGTRFFVPFAERELADTCGRIPSPVVVDLGSGTGVLAAVAVRACPGAQVIATDTSEAAARSSEATLSRNFPGSAGMWEVRQDHGLSQQPADSVDLILCNPPFHSEAAISTALSEHLFREAARALKPGGVMLTVFNSHLRHRAALERLVGPTEQLGRSPKFTVTRSVKR